MGKIVIPAYLEVKEWPAELEAALGFRASPAGWIVIPSLGENGRIEVFSRQEARRKVNELLVAGIIDMAELKSLGGQIESSNLLEGLPKGATDTLHQISEGVREKIKEIVRAAKTAQTN